LMTKLVIVVSSKWREWNRHRSFSSKAVFAYYSRHISGLNIAKRADTFFEESMFGSNITRSEVAIIGFKNGTG
jgi:hypothetical protein